MCNVLTCMFHALSHTHTHTNTRARARASARTHTHTHTHLRTTNVFNIEFGIRSSTGFNLVGVIIMCCTWNCACAYICSQVRLFISVYWCRPICECWCVGYTREYTQTIIVYIQIFNKVVYIFVYLLLVLYQISACNFKMYKLCTPTMQCDCEA